MKFNLDHPETDRARMGRAMKPIVNVLARHGAIYSILDEDFVDKLIERAVQKDPSLSGQEEDLRSFMASVAAQTFKYLADLLPGKNNPYLISTPLISHLTFPHEGRTFTPFGTDNDNRHIPAVFTFIGQFIDHDLTLNPIDLFNPQGTMTPDEASPVIDLDSVYGPRASMLQHGTTAQIFNPDGTFQLRPVAATPPSFDLVRDTTPGDFFNKPFMNDLRNDENQLILQIHILLIRVHNKLVRQSGGAAPYGSPAFAAIQKEVIRNWQSVLINDYLPTVVDNEPLSWVLGEIQKPGYGDLRHKPETNGSVRMPHEFAIGFRMGHSQLRDSYHLNGNYAEIRLFDNQNPMPNDLRGARPLEPSHTIDWPFFTERRRHSNKIDRHVTSVVFDLPQSTIPDNVKQVGNLPQRNLIRSTIVMLSAAEDLINLYGVQAHKLTHAEIEPDPDKRDLFRLDKDGNFEAGNPFRTPLWYYVLKEAEVQHNGRKLGTLGGRIVSEVIAGGIYYQNDAYVHDAAWTSAIIKNLHGTNSRIVKFNDLVDFILAP